MVNEAGRIMWAADHDTWGTVRQCRTWRSTTHEPDGEFVLTSKTDIGIVGNAALARKTEPDPLMCPIRFQGQWEDGETGLYYNRFRYYEPMVGQYVSPDPIQISGGVNNRAYATTPIVEYDPYGLRNSLVNNGVLCLVNKFTLGGILSDEFDAFVGLWDGVAKDTPGGLTRRTMTPALTKEANRFRRRAKRELCCSGMGNLAPGHTPDTAWGGAADPGDAWVPLEQDVNQYIGGLTQGVAPGTNYTSVKSVRDIADC